MSPTIQHTYYFADCSGRGLTLLTMAGRCTVRQAPDGTVTATPTGRPVVSQRRRRIAEHTARRAFAEWCETLPAEAQSAAEVAP